ncbi:MAG: hypothetical protein K0R38_1475 [Polyangiaceae bacterium]|jgi:hypothetical protein|nr:hypothetical protein [Polyangiaceae bacterium]
MQKQHAQEAESASPTSGAPATPRVSGEVVKGSVPEAAGAEETPLPSSNRRAAETAAAPPGSGESSDTLLSAGKPADRFELLLEDGLSRIEARLRDLDARLSVLEQKKPSPVPEPRHKPWLWIVFLVTLVVVFQMLQRVR